MKRQFLKSLRFIVFLMTLALVSAGLFATGQGEAAKAKLLKVRVGVAPYTMFQIWPAAKELGIDKEFGIELDLVSIAATLPGVQLLVRNDLDISSNAIAEHIAAIQNAPQIKAFSSLGYFQGFIFVGRKGKIKPIDDLIKEYGPEKAKQMRLAEFKDKEFAVIPQRKPLILDAIQQVDLGEADIKLLNFADDQKAAMAFIKGSGDFYMGSLPQEQRLLKMKDEFVNAGGAEVLGPGGLWYDIMVTSDTFLNNHREAALRTLGVLYRTIKLFKENPQKIAKIAAAAIAKATGGDFSVDDYITMQTQYDQFLTIDDVKAGMYNPNSDLYWKRPVEYYVKMAVEQGDLAKPISADEYFPWEKLFNEFLSRSDLIAKVNASFSP